MNKRVLGCFLLVACGIHGYQHTAKSFLSTINPFQLNFPERISSFYPDRRQVKECGWGGSLQLVGIWQDSRESEKLAEYFFPFNKNTLVAGEWSSAAAAARTNDLVAEYFGLFTRPLGNEDVRLGNFQSSLCMKPQHKVYGVGISWQQRLPKCLWFDISTAIVQVRNKLHMHEVIENVGSGNTPSGAYSNMTDALASTRLDFGRFTNCVMKKNGFADIEVRLGMESEICGTCATGGMYLGGVIPTGNRVGKVGSPDCSCANSCPTSSALSSEKNRYLFSPVVGNNHHYGFMFGAYSALLVFHDSCDNPVSFHTDLNCRYLFENTQRRSFDVKGKPWSRYIPVWATGAISDAQTTPVISDLKPLINYSTLCAKVTPGWSMDWNSALRYKRSCFAIELGSNVFVREGERVCISESLRPNLGFADVYNWAGRGVTFTTSLETINNDNFGAAVDFNMNGNAEYVSITTSQLDSESAASPAVFNATLYGAASGEWNNCRLPLFASVGGGYTFTADNASVEGWTIWCKIGCSF
jgi:hypothetical protein